MGVAISRFKPGIMKMYLYVLLTGGIVSAGMLSYTAYLGGQIRHTEIRPETTAGQSGAVASTLDQIEDSRKRT